VALLFFFSLDAQYLLYTEAIDRRERKFRGISVPSQVSPGIDFRALLHASFWAAESMFQWGWLASYLFAESLLFT
jgi:hypothetical protein